MDNQQLEQLRLENEKLQAELANAQANTNVDKFTKQLQEMERELEIERAKNAAVRKPKAPMKKFEKGTGRNKVVLTTNNKTMIMTLKKDGYTEVVAQ